MEPVGVTGSIAMYYFMYEHCLSLWVNIKQYKAVWCLHTVHVISNKYSLASLFVDIREIPAEWLNSDFRVSVQMKGDSNPLILRLGYKSCSLSHVYWKAGRQALLYCSKIFMIAWSLLIFPQSIWTLLRIILGRGFLQWLRTRSMLKGLVARWCPQGKLILEGTVPALIWCSITTNSQFYWTGCLSTESPGTR